MGIHSNFSSSVPMVLCIVSFSNQFANVDFVTETAFAFSDNPSNESNCKRNVIFFSFGYQNSPPIVLNFHLTDLLNKSEYQNPLDRIREHSPKPIQIKYFDFV